MLGLILVSRRVLKTKLPIFLAVKVSFKAVLGEIMKTPSSPFEGGGKGGGGGRGDLKLPDWSPLEH